MNARCKVCRQPAEVNDLCDRCRETIRATVAEMPPLTPDQVHRVARLLTLP